MARKLPETNPFVSRLLIHGLWVRRQTTENGAAETSGTAYHLRAFKVEREARTTLYTDGVLQLFLGLSSVAKDMFMYIAAHLPQDKDYLEISEERYMKETGASRATFYRAKSDLTNLLIIPRKERSGTYWIDPACMFRGNRIEKYPGNVRMNTDGPFELPKAAPESVNQSHLPVTM